MENPLLMGTISGVQPCFVTQLPDRITWAPSWITDTEPVTSVWMRKVPCAVHSHSIAANRSAPGSCRITHSSSPIQMKAQALRKKKKKYFSVNSGLKGWTACAKETLKLTNWNATGREKSGNNSPVTDPFKLIMKPCREATSSSSPAYSQTILY